jgi:hypothetical protein
MVPDDTLYIHWQFHPAGVHKDTIWKKKTHKKTLQGCDNFKDAIETMTDNIPLQLHWKFLLKAN